MTKTSNVLNGNEIAAKRLEKIAKELSEFRRSGVALTLCTVQIGHARDTELYAKSIADLLQKLDIWYLPLIFVENIEEKKLRQEILKASQDPKVTGILIFAPLPPHLALGSLLRTAGAFKDVEGRLTPLSAKSKIMPPTAMAAIALFEETGYDAAGKEALVVGRSDVVGKPAALMLLEKNATVTIAHSKTVNLKDHVQRADIVIVSVGKPELIKGDWIKPGAVVIDVGENVINGKLVGDVEFEKAKDRASHLSPVPGGVGPVTNVMLVQNLISLYKLQSLHHGNS